ncbi:unnamed protein product, partial [Meganyctiphanes norvegica]
KHVLQFPTDEDLDLGVDNYCKLSLDIDAGGNVFWNEDNEHWLDPTEYYDVIQIMTKGTVVPTTFFIVAVFIAVVQFIIILAYMIYIKVIHKQNQVIENINLTKQMAPDNTQTGYTNSHEEGQDYIYESAYDTVTENNGSNPISKLPVTWRGSQHESLNSLYGATIGR